MCVVILVHVQSVSSIVSVHGYLGYLVSEIAVDIIIIIDIYIIIYSFKIVLNLLLHDITILYFA